MAEKQTYSEADLARLTKELREKAGKSKAEVARALKVTPSSIQFAEEYPEQSMTKLRIRIIEACSPYKVVGPTFWLEKK